LLAERLRQVIEDRLVDDAEAWCEAAGLSRGFLSSFFVRAKGSPGASLKGTSASALAGAAGVRTEWLLTGEGPRERRPEQTTELDGDIDPRIVAVGAALGAPAHVIRAAHDLRGARGTAGLTDAAPRGKRRPECGATSHLFCADPLRPCCATVIVRYGRSAPAPPPRPGPRRPPCATNCTTTS